jgi:ankyrin repeat protein
MSVQSQVSSQVNMNKPTATIMSLPLEVGIMIIERLRLEDALNMAKALKLPEQVAVQYFACDSSDSFYIFYESGYDLQPSSFKFLLKNKRFQAEATSDAKTTAAVKTKDLDFLKRYLEQVEPDLNYALFAAAIFGFTDAVKLLLLDYGVDPSARDNQALINASYAGHLEIVKLLLSDARVDPSARDNDALIDASDEGHLEIVKLLLSDARVDPSAQDNQALRSASRNGHLEIVKILLSDDRVDPSAEDNQALGLASQNGHSEIVKLLESHPRFEASDSYLSENESSLVESDY